MPLTLHRAFWVHLTPTYADSWAKRASAELQTASIPWVYAARFEQPVDIDTVLADPRCRAAEPVTEAVYPAGWPRLEALRTAAERPTPRRISRAALKMEEAQWRLEQLGIASPAPRRWLELGAAPGGITSVLLDNPGDSVVAVDVAPLSETLAGHPRLEFHLAEAQGVEVAGPFDGLVVDINGALAIARRATARLASQLRPGAAVVYTLKIPDWDQLGPIVRKTIAALERAGVEVCDVRHLVANRMEVTLLGRATSSSL